MTIQQTFPLTKYNCNSFILQWSAMTTQQTFQLTKYNSFNLQMISNDYIAIFFHLNMELLNCHELPCVIDMQVVLL